MEKSSREWLRPELLRSWGEFLLVSALLLFMPIRNSTLGALHGSSHHFFDLLLSDRHLLGSLVAESVALAAFLYYLHRRGWRPADLKIGIGWSTSAQGVVLLLAAWGTSIVVVALLMVAAFKLQTAQPNFLAFLTSVTPKFGPGPIHMTWFVMFAAMVINAFAEELVMMGYIFNQLAARRGLAVALPVTIFLRMACHTYQDPMHLGGIGTLFTIFAVWYCFGRRLWPLILAHLLLDTIAGTMLPLIQHLQHQLGPALVYGG